MSEKLYSLLLNLYPNHFRRAYGDEAMRLFLDRARDEKGLLFGLRLWVDVLVDLAKSLPREYSRASAARVLVANPANGGPSFKLLTELTERPLNPALLFVAILLTAASFWTCVTAVAHSRLFPVRFPADSYSLQTIVQSDVALARTPSNVSNAGGGPVDSYSLCVMANRDVSNDSLRPLMRFNFAAPGASGEALIDGKIVETFKNEQRLWIHADVSAGNHWLVLRVDRPAENASISGNGDLKYCPAK